MRIARHLLTTAVILGLAVSPAFAGEMEHKGEAPGQSAQMMDQGGGGGGQMMGQGGQGMMDKGMMSRGEMWQKRMEEHRKLTRDLLEMMKETMAIVRDMSHKPSADQKKKLDELIKKADEMITRHEEMMKQMQEKMQDKMEKMQERMDKMQDKPAGK